MNLFRYTRIAFLSDAMGTIWLHYHNNKSLVPSISIMSFWYWYLGSQLLFLSEKCLITDLWWFNIVYVLPWVAFITSLDLCLHVNGWKCRMFCAFLAHLIHRIQMCLCYRKLEICWFRSLSTILEVIHYWLLIGLDRSHDFWGEAESGKRPRKEWKEAESASHHLSCDISQMCLKVLDLLLCLWCDN